MLAWFFFIMNINSFSKVSKILIKKQVSTISFFFVLVVPNLSVFIVGFYSHKPKQTWIHWMLISLVMTRPTWSQICMYFRGIIVVTTEIVMQTLAIENISLNDGKIWPVFKALSSISSNNYCVLHPTLCMAEELEEL